MFSAQTRHMCSALWQCTVRLYSLTEWRHFCTDSMPHQIDNVLAIGKHASQNVCTTAYAFRIHSNNLNGQSDTCVRECRIGGRVVSVFYLRAGYSPDDYPGQAEWAGREAMESCSAISCPSVAYQLVGAKKIQQDLATPGA